MDLLERYLQAVRFFLPRHNLDDIVRELSENLISQMEDRGEELGRPLNEDECADIRRRHGHPMVVAGRYRTHQQLIGSLFLPIYLFALKVGLGVAFIVTIVIAMVAALLHGDVGRRFLEAMFQYPGRALMVFAWTTLGFAALDLAQSRLKLTHKWDPRALPKLVRHEERISRANSLCELLAAVAMTIWLLFVPQSPFLILGPAAAILELAPIWSLVYLPILAVTVGTAALGFVNFTRPFWTPARSLARLAIHTTTLIVCVVIMRSDSYLLAKSAAALSDGVSMDRVVDIANRGVEIGIVVAVIINLVEIAREIHRWQSRRKLSSASGSGAAQVTR